MRFLLIFLAFLYFLPSYGQKIEHNRLKNNITIFLLDSVLVPRDSVEYLIKKDEVSEFSILRSTDPILQQLGIKTQDDAIFIISKSANRKKYQNYLGAKSAKFRKLIMEDNLNANVQFIINNQVVKQDVEKALSKINDENFILLKVLNKDKLKKEFQVEDKDFGVSIRTK
ncbi:hypothetical protein PZ892_06135 [Sphingobacterium sp. WM]|uniref:hypothetical protein n=1 Tax=Sphingobacterium sp. WM TaxID=3031802 RepID=UPI00240D35B7|nr:hypothetical protein [Sphingobacterium sp. WM]WFB64782.1 hypothetical protein PZ892_06135 [Sphingobacterium sp. WM]